MSARLPPLVFGATRGAVETVSPMAIPEGFARSAVNVELSADVLFLPRAGVTAITLGATLEVFYLFTERIDGAETLWQLSDFLSGTPTAHRGGSAIAFSDTVALSTVPDALCAVAFNEKVFLAYNSNVNRMHVYSESVMRRVGIGLVAAATVANTGSGAYPATLRYYKVQMRLHKGSDASLQRLASSELSAVVSFTPSGAGTAARVTKPTTIDSATHWAVYGSADGITYYDISGSLAVSATTYDDTYLVNNYWATGAVSPEAGLFVPPPSCKFLATNGERLFMAGAWESTASAGQTTPTPRRVWFTRPSGATDQGDDESITQTGDLRYWLDIDNEDGSPITGMISSVDGSIYVGTATSVWRLSDTGQSDEPMRSVRVVAGFGVTHNGLMTMDGSTLYFGDASGPYRYSLSHGLEYLGADWVRNRAPLSSTSSFDNMASCAFDPSTRRIAWLYNRDSSAIHGKVRWFHPSLASAIDGVVRGGWSLDDYENAGRLRTAAVYLGSLYFGGRTPSTANDLIFTRDMTQSTDGGVEYISSIITRTVVLSDGESFCRTEEPLVWRNRNLSLSFVLSRNFGGTGNTSSDTLTADVPGMGDAQSQRIKVEGLVVADAYCLDLELSTTIPVVTLTTRERDGVDRVTVPVFLQERA